MALITLLLRIDCFMDDDRLAIQQWTMKHLDG